MRRGKSGLKRYLLDRLHKVKEVFRNEMTSRDELKAKDMEPHTDNKVDETMRDQSLEGEMISQGTQGITDVPSTPVAAVEAQCESLEKPQLSEPERNQVLRVQHRAEPNDAIPTAFPKGLKEYKDSAGRQQVKWTGKSMKKVRKVMEICTWTMMISSLAVERDPEHWKVCRPITIDRI